MKVGISFLGLISAVVATTQGVSTPHVGIYHKLLSANCAGAVINDDFCDCGTDENLTSACSMTAESDSSFQCAFELPVPQKIFLSRVSE